MLGGDQLRHIAVTVILIGEGRHLLRGVHDLIVLAVGLPLLLAVLLLFLVALPELLVLLLEGSSNCRQISFIFREAPGNGCQDHIRYSCRLYSKSVSLKLLTDWKSARSTGSPWISSRCLDKFSRRCTSRSRCLSPYSL